MRITFVLADANMAGGTRVIAIYAERLRQRGHQVGLVSPLRRVPDLRSRIRSLIQGRGWPDANPIGPSHFDGRDVDLRRLERHRQVTEADVPDADVVIATWWETADWVARFPRCKGAKAYFVQDFGATQAQPIAELARTWQLPLHKLVISHYIMELVRQHSGDTQVTYIPNAVDLRQFRAEPRGRQSRPTAGTVYAPTERFKGTDIALEAVRMARLRVPELRLVTFGSRAARHLPLPPATDHAARVSDERLAGIYARCDAWLFPPRMEGFGLPILEAMACRTPVIATPAGAAPELVGQGGGILVPHDDPATMAEAIERVVTLPDREWRAMSEQAYRTASSFTWDQATDLFEQGLRTAVDRSARGEL